VNESPSPKNNNNKNSSFGKALFPSTRPTTVSGTQSTSGDLSQVPCSRPPAAPECKKTGEDIHSRYSSVVFTPTAKILPSTFNVCASDKVERCTPLIEKKKTVCYLKMPVPASEEADGLQTPEVYSQNELYGRFDSSDKMEDIFGLDCLANIGGATPTPCGSQKGAPSDFKFDLEHHQEINLDAKESSSSPSASVFNVDDLLNTDLHLFDDNLPLSSQEMNNLCNSMDIDIEASKISMSIEEQNDAPVSAASGQQWVGVNNNAAAAVQPIADKFSQFAVSSVNSHEESKPDILQNALFQSDAMSHMNGIVNAEDLANATFVMVANGNGDEALNQIITIDPSTLLQLGNGIANDGTAIDASAIPLTVQQAAEPMASTSAAYLDHGAAASSSALVVAKVEESDADEGAVDTTSTATPPSRGGRKRKAASVAPSVAASSVADDDDEWTADAAETLDYKEKRRRNNLAVRKSRALAKEKQKTTEAENERLREENEKKSREIEILQREIKIYKELFERSGFAMPRK